MATNQFTAPLNNLKILARSKDMVMALSLVVIVSLMLLPLPSFVLDLLIALNIAISIGIVLLTMFITQPLEFSVFPTVLLLVTLYRLGINIATSRLILLNGSAGKVVDTFGSLMVGGNYVVGIVIFLILMIIQFVVINNGAGRVAEVSARFTLDAMPGKQLSIDADLNAGLIDEQTARKRRREIETEADFYGAMDGSSKFVKNDAVAAIIIMVVNIIGGFLIGIVQNGMEFTQALQTYTLLTVGAGLAVQIPALLVSAASGLVVTRSTSDNSLGTDLFKQVGNFNMLAVAAVMVAVMSLIPGIPKAPFLLVGSGMGVAAFFVQKLKDSEKAEALDVQASEAALVSEAEEPESPEDMLKMVVVDPVEMEIGYSLIPLIDDEQADNLLRRVTGIRRQVMQELGLVLPVVRIRDNLRLPPQTYRIKIRGQEVARGELMLDRVLAIPGSDVDENLPGVQTTEPAFGLPAIWVSESERGRAELMGYTVVNPLSVLSTHFTEVVRGHSSDLLSRQMVQEMINQIRSKSPAAVDGVIPDLLSLGDLQSVLRSLLDERVPIRDMVGILEVLANNAGMTRDPHILAEAVRQSLAHTLSSQFRDDGGTLHVFTLSPQVEAELRNGLSQSEGGIGFQIDAAFAQKVIARTGEMMEKLASMGFIPILLCSRELRLAFHNLVSRSLPNLIVMAYSEVSSNTRVKAHGMVLVD
ncbi:flagellar biosynthesis protein FlhA [Ornatilinea apprima]|uniref:Flagellar biosynthesis protein FlhA n=1 Tax=Ornatilinea apprima TaxID=1134406 RepID=A0A0P6X8C1_9CHLR|nr:flagellar biosynthesis protein FlhA [Ornatilinea apprima]KPL71421.1 flagellar biosynthesis protein FlhA [Ornatilinea apprima]